MDSLPKNVHISYAIQIEFNKIYMNVGFDIFFILYVPVNNFSVMLE